MQVRERGDDEGMIDRAGAQELGDLRQGAGLDLEDLVAFRRGRHRAGRVEREVRVESIVLDGRIGGDMPRRRQAVAV